MKAVTVYTFNGEVPTIDTLHLEQYVYSPCGDLQMSTMGFSLNVDQEYVSEVAGNVCLQVTRQSKVPNKFEVDSKTEGRVKALELARGTPLHKKEKAAVLEEVIMEILPKTFPNKPTTHKVFITKAGLLFVEGTAKVAEEVTALIRKAVGSLPIIPIDVRSDVCGKMTELVTQDEFDKITLKDKITLETQEERKVNITNGTIEGGEGTELIKDGAVVVAIQLNYDGILDFMLGENLNVSSMKFDKSLTEDVESSDQAGTFILQMTETVNMFSELIDLFGGLSEG